MMKLDKPWQDMMQCEKTRHGIAIALEDKNGLKTSC